MALLHTELTLLVDVVKRAKNPREAPFERCEVFGFRAGRKAG
jgi:hypothetical protein